MIRVFKKTEGFTLIELLIVMAIIAILIGICLPRFRGMQDEGAKSKARSNLATLRTAVEAYAAAPRTNGRTKYPDASDLNAQAAYTGVRTAATGWMTTHLTVDHTTNVLGTNGPIMLSAELLDPFSPAAGNVEYGFNVNAQGYYVIWSNGTGRVNTACTCDAVGAVTAPGTSLYVSNGTPQSN